MGQAHVETLCVATDQVDMCSAEIQCPDRIKADIDPQPSFVISGAEDPGNGILRDVRSAVAELTIV